MKREKEENYVNPCQVHLAFTDLKMVHSNKLWKTLERSIKKRMEILYKILQFFIPCKDREKKKECRLYENLQCSIWKRIVKVKILVILLAILVGDPWDNNPSLTISRHFALHLRHLALHLRHLRHLALHLLEVEPQFSFWLDNWGSAIILASFPRLFTCSFHVYYGKHTI